MGLPISCTGRKLSGQSWGPQQQLSKIDGAMDSRSFAKLHLIPPETPPAYNVAGS